MNYDGFRWVWRNGEIIDDRSMALNRDSPILQGVGIFTTIGVFGSKPRFVEAHWNRIKKGCIYLGLDCPEFEVFQASISELLAANDNPLHCRVKVILTPTPNLTSYVSGGSSNSSVSILAAEAARPFSTASLTVLPYRLNENSALAGIKSLSYGENTQALKWAKAHGYDEGLFLTCAGSICEATSANIFYKHRDQWYTPALSTGCLEGVTRGFVMNQFHILGVEVKEVEHGVEYLRESESMFLTSSIRLLRTIESLDGSELTSAGDRHVRALIERLTENVAE